MDETTVLINQIVCDINDSFSTIGNISLEKKLTTLDNLDKLTFLNVSMEKGQGDGVFVSSQFTSQFNKSDLAASGISKLIDGVRTIVQKTGTGIDNLKNSKDNKKLNEKYIWTQLNKIKEKTSKVPDEEPTIVKNGFTYQLIMKRIDGLQSMCAKFRQHAQSGDVESFRSDSIWEQFASTSNNVVKCVAPDEGSKFKQFQWVLPLSQKFDVRKSEWMDDAKINEMVKAIMKLKQKAFDDLEHVCEYLKKLCIGQQKKSQVQHTRNDNYQSQTLIYSRTYLLGKLVQNIQQIIIKELYFITSTLVKQNLNYGKNILEKAADKVKGIFKKNKNKDKDKEQKNE